MVLLDRCRLFLIALVLGGFVCGTLSGIAQESGVNPAAESGEESKTQSPVAELLSPIATGFVQKLARGEFAEAVTQFDETMTKALPADRLEMVWKNVTQAVGDYRESTGTHHEAVDVYDIIFVTCKFERASLDVKFVFDKERRVTGLFFVPVTHREAYRPPAYVDEAAYREVEVTFGKEPWVISGTRIIPGRDEQARSRILSLMCRGMPNIWRIRPGN